jgi:hypothetical protein
MPRPPTSYDSSEPQSLDEISEWNRGVADALRDHYTAVRAALRRGAVAKVPARYVGMTEAELDSLHDAQREELDRLTILALVASVEASIRADYAARISGNGNDPLSKGYRAWHGTLSFRKQVRPDFDEGGILDQLRAAAVVPNHLIGNYRECLRARHWVGHGRYWDKPEAVDRFDPADVHARGTALLAALPPP